MATVKFNNWSEARGSVNGTTYARNRAGAYARSRTVPVNPSSALQDVVRAAVGTLASRWRETLTAAQRSAWDNYALNTPRPNKVGDPINVGGIGMYVRGNVPRIQSGLDIVDDGPIDFGVPQVGLVSMTSFSTGTVTVAYDDTLPWVDDNGAGLLIYISNRQSVAKNFFGGPYRFAAIVEGSANTAPTSPEIATFPYQSGLVSGSRLFMRAVVASADGRLSDDSQDAANATFI